MPRVFELLVSITFIILLTPFFLVLFILLFITGGFSVFFVQTRIGQHGKPFTIYKLRTMKNGQVTRVGKFLRKTKIDELPQLYNILKGDMTFVGPRPDISGYYDKLSGENRRLLQLKPGLTSLAAIKYRDEEQILAQQENPLAYNDNVLFPDKVKMNLEYLDNRSFALDLKIIWLTLVSIFSSKKVVQQSV